MFFIITDCNTDQCATSSSLYCQRQKFICCRCHRQTFYYSLSKMPKQFDCCAMFICCCEMLNKNLSAPPPESLHRPHLLCQKLLFMPAAPVSDLSFAGTFLICIQILPYLIPRLPLPDRHGHIGTANMDKKHDKQCNKINASDRSRNCFPKTVPHVKRLARIILYLFPYVVNMAHDNIVIACFLFFLPNSVFSANAVYGNPLLFHLY